MREPWPRRDLGRRAFVIDNPAQVEQLIANLKAALPLSATVSPPLLALLQEQSPDQRLLEQQAVEGSGGHARLRPCLPLRRFRDAPHPPIRVAAVAQHNNQIPSALLWSRSETAGPVPVTRADGSGLSQR